LNKLRLILVTVIDGGNTSALSGEINLVGEAPSTGVSVLEPDLDLTGLSSRLCDRKLLMQETNLKVDSPIAM
jgi:hypothetical protein